MRGPASGTAPPHAQHFLGLPCSSAASASGSLAFDGQLFVARNVLIRCGLRTLRRLPPPLVLARFYTAVNKAQIRAEFERTSAEAGVLQVGEEVEMLEARITPDTGVVRTHSSQI